MPLGTWLEVDGISGVSGTLEEALLVDAGSVGWTKLLEEAPVPLGIVELQKRPFQPLYWPASASVHIAEMQLPTALPFAGEQSALGSLTW